MIELYMITGYTEDPFAGQPQRMRRPRVGRDVPRSRRPDRISSYYEETTGHHQESVTEAHLEKPSRAVVGVAQVRQLL